MDNKVKKLQHSWIEFKNQEQKKQEQILIKRNILMNRFLKCDPSAISAIRKLDKNKATKEFIANREQNIGVLSWLAKNAVSCIKRMESKKKLKVEVFRLENARQIVRANCRVHKEGWELKNA